jgi:hypothetical protein
MQEIESLRSEIVEEMPGLTATMSCEYPAFPALSLHPRLNRSLISIVRISIYLVHVVRIQSTL